MLYKHAIIGLGVAGILTLALLPKDDLANTLVIEPSNIGGSLAAQYSNVVANITKDIIVGAFSKIPGWDVSQILIDCSGSSCPMLSDVCKDMRRLIANDLKCVTFRTVRMTDLIETATGWTIVVQEEMLEAQNVYLCTGATPKIMDLPIPHIPLDIALNQDMLKRYVAPSDRIVVFGVSHSGTLILKNLKNLGCKHVHAVFSGQNPFSFARDGDTEGLKAESATIADEILANAWGELTPVLFKTTDFAKSYRYVSSATLVIYAIGFAEPKISYITKTGERRCLKFRADTNGFESTQTLWGFGIGFPSLYTAPNGNQYKDVGFGGFIEAIQRGLRPLLNPLL